MEDLLEQLEIEANNHVATGEQCETYFGNGMIRVISAIREYNAKNKEIDNATHYLCDDEEYSIEQQIEFIKAHEHEYDLIDYVENVTVWEKVEGKITCKEFLNMIS